MKHFYLTRKLLNFLWISVFALFLWSCRPGSLLLTDSGMAECSIVVSDTTSSDILALADTLSLFCRRISGTSLPILHQQEAGEGNLLFLGCTPAGCPVPLPDTLGPDGFAIQFHNRHIFIRGHTPAGISNGVYAFLEEYMGCRFYANDGPTLPLSPIIRVQKKNSIQKPAFSFREIHGPEPLNPSWRDWHRLHRKGENSPEWGMFVHTFHRLVPPSEWFLSHPEYFSKVGGMRIPDGQLCLSNPEMMKVLLQSLHNEMAMKPHALYWSVSQNDTYKNCECDQCRHLDSLYGGPSGTLIWFVNQVAENFPDKIISTLAYQYTRQAPRNIRPLPNVNVMLCTIECDRAKTIAQDEGFTRDIREWSRLTTNIFLWDYVVQFRNYLNPFPNFHVLQPNLRLFRDFGAGMMFQQGSGRSWSDMMELKQYLIAKLLWNPDADADAVVKDFLDGYYGAAGPIVGRYLKLREEALLASGGRLGIYGFPWDGFFTYLSPKMLNCYDQLADSALDAVSDNTRLTARVQKAMLPLIFARLDISLHEPDTVFSFVKREGKQVMVRPEMLSLLDTLVVRSARLKVFDADERGTTPDSYRYDVKSVLEETLRPGKAYKCQVRLVEPPSENYPVGGAAALTDGIRGLNDYNVNWAGFYGNEMNATLDLGSVQQVDTVSVRFLQFIQAWIFLPKTVAVEASEDGIRFRPVGKAVNPYGPEETGSFTFDFTVTPQNLRTRYIRLSTTSLLQCPPGHPGHGLDSWIFTDEVVVR